jgi:hypothetical protein
MCVYIAGHNSPPGSNALFCYQRYGFDLEPFRFYSVSLDNKFYINWYKAHVPEEEAANAMSLIKLLFVRDEHFSLLNFSYSNIMDLINCIAST